MWSYATGVDAPSGYIFMQLKYKLGRSNMPYFHTGIFCITSKHASSVPSYIGWMFLSESCQTLRHGFNCLHGQAPPYLVELCQLCRITATSSIRHATAPGRTASPAPLLWPTGFLCGWSIGLDFSAGQLAESDYWQEQFQTVSEDVFVRNVLMHSAH